MAIETFTSPGTFQAVKWTGSAESLDEVTAFVGADRVSVVGGKLFLDLRRADEPAEADDEPTYVPVGWDVRKYEDGLMYVSSARVRDERWTRTGA